MVNLDITEASAVQGFPQFDLSAAESAAAWEPTKAAYDVSINNLPFFLRISNQYPYGRQTAQYKKDQFDTSSEPGEQSLTGWWLRSQTSWHEGAGITYYEPGVEKNVSHRFKNSRGVDVWNIGELRLHKKVTYAYNGVSGINAASGQYGKTVGATTVPTDVLVSGDQNGILKRIELNGNSNVTSDAAYVKNYTAGATYPDGHGGTDYPFYSVTTDGSTYYAACNYCIHKGSIGTMTSDDIFFKHSNSATGNTKVLVKYAKGNVFIGAGQKFALLNTNATASALSHGTGGGVDTFSSNAISHINTSWNWIDATASPGPLFFAGNGGNNGEIWAATIDTSDTTPTNAIDLAAASMALSLPDGEFVNSIHYYLGYLAVGTSLGIRICPIGNNDLPILGPLLFESDYPVNGFTERGTYLYAATKVDNTTYTSAILVRIDLSQQFEDGTFAYANDLEYAPTTSNADCTEVYNIEDRLVMVVQENGATAGELQVEHTTDYVSSGFLETGLIRYATVEPKFFKYLRVNGSSTGSDVINVYVTDHTGAYVSVDNIGINAYGTDLPLNDTIDSQETIGIKFVFNNTGSTTNDPVVTSYQLKSLPATKRQRIIEYPLSCFDVEMDRFNSSTGYVNSGYERLSALEALEELGDTVTITDYRTNEKYEGIIENIRFSNESSPDKNNNGYGGIVIVTVRKI